MGEASFTVKVTVEPEQVAPAAAPTDALAKATATPGDVAAVRVIKSTEEQRFVLGVAYPANKPDVARALDGHRDAAAPEVVEKAAWDWLRTSRRNGLWHKDGTVGHIEVVESTIYRGPDWTTTCADGSQVVIKAGDWLMGAVLDPEAWAAAKAGLVDGWSPQGGATRARLTPERRAELRS